MSGIGANLKRWIAPNRHAALVQYGGAALAVWVALSLWTFSPVLHRHLFVLLLAAVLLGVGRAVGETMAVLMATGHAVKIPTSVMDSVRTLTATIAAELGEAPMHSRHYQVLFIIGILLFTITFVINLTADLVVRGVRGR